MRKMLTVCWIVLTWGSFTSAFGESLACYHKVGNLCKGGYASGYLSDCETPCNTGNQESIDSPVSVHPIASTNVVNCEVSCNNGKTKKWTCSSDKPACCGNSVNCSGSCAKDASQCK
jgi:hypothetical protein